MNALAIIEAATAEGLVVGLAPSGSLKAVGEQEVVDRWRPLLKQHKVEIINLLSREPGGAVVATRPLPSWCRGDCPGLEVIPLPNEGDVAGCVHPITGAWRRLDWLTECPAMKNVVTRPALPEWCKGSQCDCFHRANIPGVGTLQWCWQARDETHWRQDRIDTMIGCPLRKSIIE